MLSRAVGSQSLVATESRVNCKLRYSTVSLALIGRGFEIWTSFDWLLDQVTCRTVSVSKVTTWYSTCNVT